MNKNYTLKELADIGAKAANSCLPEGVRMCVLSGSPPHHVVARQAFTKAVLDAIGYEFPKDAEREAFYTWWKANRIAFCNEEHAFQLWKAGREELRQAINKPSYSTPEQIDKSIQNLTTKEPAWIPWYGGDKSPIVGEQTRYEVECRSGARNIWNTNFLRWSHDGSLGDIMAYRILDSDKCEETKTEPEWWEPEWISWNGGRCPIPERTKREGLIPEYPKSELFCCVPLLSKCPIPEDTKCEVKFRNGGTDIGPAKRFDWDHVEESHDIIAYRIILD